MPRFAPAVLACLLTGCDAPDVGAEPEAGVVLACDDFALPDLDPSLCLRVEEVFYVAEFGAQWIDIRNICDRSVKLERVSVQYTRPVYEWAWGVQPLKYASGIKSIPANGCARMGTDADILRTFDPEIEVPLEESAEGLGLFVFGSHLPFDAVIYGSKNSRSIPNESGSIAPPTAPDVTEGHSIRRSGVAWIDEANPRPGKCE